MDGCNDRLVARLQLVKRLAQIRPLHRFTEFGDIGTCKKSPSVAADDHGLYAIIGERLVDAVDQTLANRGAERVYRRIVGNDDQNIVMFFSGYDRHFSLLKDHAFVAKHCVTA